MSAPAPLTQGSGESTPDRTVTGRIICNKLVDERLARTFSQNFGLSDITARLLAMRVGDVDQARRFLVPRLRDSLPDPDSLKEMDRAAERLAKAIEAGERIAILGDYDVDGAASTAILLRYLRSFGLVADIHIPHRIDEGYGPNVPAISALHEKGASLLITVDCGTLSFEPLDHAKALGLDVIVLDHHAGEGRRPASTAFVNPNRPDGTAELSMLAAAGVTFLALIATNKVLRDQYGRSRETLPDLMTFLDLAALATVCDVVPLIGPNRALVAQGLRVMEKERNVGLLALAQTAGISASPSAGQIGFQLGPRINAAGRLSDPTLGTRLLATEDASEATALAQRLDDLNAERRSLEKELVDAAMATIEADETVKDEPVIIVAGRDWHPGILGIVAARLKDRFHRPAIALGIGEDGVAKGSGRSVAGFDLGGAIIEAMRAGIALTGGGHPMAAGLSLEDGKIHALRAFLTERASGQDALPEPSIDVDVVLSARAISHDLVVEIDQLRPFGAGNPEPVLSVANVQVSNARIVGNNHVSAQLKGRSGSRLSAIAFRQADTEIGKALLSESGVRFDVIGKLKADEFRGQSRVQMHIEDIAVADAHHSA